MLMIGAVLYVWQTYVMPPKPVNEVTQTIKKEVIVANEASINDPVEDTSSSISKDAGELESQIKLKLI